MVTANITLATDTSQITLHGCSVCVCVCVCMREKLEQKEMRNESETTDPLKPGSGVVCLESLSLTHTHTHNL